jgi:hypothetical protein
MIFTVPASGFILGLIIDCIHSIVNGFITGNGPDFPARQGLPIAGFSLDTFRILYL